MADFDRYSILDPKKLRAEAEDKFSITGTNLDLLADPERLIAQIEEADVIDGGSPFTRFSRTDVALAVKQMDEAELA